MDSLIALQSIIKNFGDTQVLRGVSLQIRKGEIFGLLGVNGAGKTTLIKSLLGLLNTDAGRIYLRGNRLQAKDVQEDFGFLPENFLPPQNLNAEEFLKILSWGFASKKKDIQLLLEMVGLQEHKHKTIKTYSRGMVQRLGLSCALLKDPEIVILDEPTLGLDPLGQKKVLNLLDTLNKEGKTIFFSSHILSQIARVCTRIGILHNGVIQFVGTVQEILKKHNVSVLEDAFLKEIGAS